MKRLAKIPRAIGRTAAGLVRKSVNGSLMPKPWQVETPTTAIYFANVLRDHIDESGGAKIISRIEANAFRVTGAREATVVVRHASPGLLRSLQRRRQGKVYYILDDNVAAGAADVALPDDYRQRLSRLYDNFVKPICATADEVLAPSQSILDSLQVRNSSLITPALIHDLPNLDHHDESDVRIVFNGTRSHLSDLHMIAPVLQQLVQKYPQVRLTTFLGRHAPASLCGERIEHIPPMRWEDYRRFMRHNRFHIALGPARETLFNLARSPSRILDNAGFGAVGVYSSRRPFSSWVTHGQTGLLINDSEPEWADGLGLLINSPGLRKSIARSAASLASELGNAEKLREFWVNKLHLNLPA